MARVDSKAVLEGRVPGRAPIGLIVGLVVSSLCAITALGIDAVNGAPFVIGLVLALLPVPLLVSLVLALDRLEPEPWRTLVFAFMWGAGIAVLGALLLNTWGYDYLTGPLFGADRGRFVSSVVGAPLVEESLKGAVLFGFLWFRRTELDGLTDGIIYAAMVALGFAMMENISYYMRGVHQHNLEAVFILRGVISPLGHPLFTSMTGLGVAYAALHRGRRRAVAAVVGLVGAMMLHGTWNGSTYWSLKGLGIVYVVDFFIIVGLVVLVVRERRQTVRLIDRHLHDYLGTGLVTDRDIVMLGDLVLRRRARQWARMVGGSAAGRAMSDYQLAATELALLHKRVEREVAEPAWFYRRRQALLALMQTARQSFRLCEPRSLVPPWAGHGESGFLSLDLSYGPPPPGPFARSERS